MEKKTIRVYVGNLPPDVHEEDLKKRIQKYASVTSVEMKYRSDGQFAFVDLTDSQSNLDNCFLKLPSKSWKGHQIKVQLAKESFLQRLARERLENKKHYKENSSVCADVPNTVKVSILPNSIYNSVSKIIPKNNKPNFNDCSDGHTTDDSFDSTIKEVTKKGKLQRFAGTKVLIEDEDERVEPESRENSKLCSNKISTKKLDEEKEILEKFEMFNNVWKDTSSDDSVKEPVNTADITSRKRMRKEVSGNLKSQNTNMGEKISMSKLQSNIPQSQREQCKIKIKIEEAEKRRVKALEDRQKELLKRKQVVQFALASVDKTNTPNKRTVFAQDDGESIAPTEISTINNGDQKLSLFGDDEMEYETNNDFRIRKQFEGEKGHSLLALQTRYGSDKRFTLDERFIESDGERSAEEDNPVNTEISDTQAEREKVLRVLETVLGKKVPDTSKMKMKNTTIKPMLRYDPTKPDHTKFEIRHDNSVEVKSKKKREKTVMGKCPSKGVDDVPEEVVDNLPVVSKERYYQVSDTLQQTLQNSEQKFSLLEMFGEEDSSVKEADIPFNVKPIMNKKEWSVNPFNKDSSASEDELEERNHTINDGYDEKNVGVKQESLFFNKNDARFLEGLNFINHINEEYLESFGQIRKDLKSIVKKKVMNNKKKAEKWKAKIGGKRKNPVSGKGYKQNMRR